MTQKIEGDTRARIAAFLPDAIAKALTSYQLFLEEGAHNDAKEFKAHHDACKVAIAHLELLIKLAQWADLPDPTAEGHNHQKMLEGVIGAAMEELHDYNRKEDTDE
jgi:hypothetical protein